MVLCDTRVSQIIDEYWTGQFAKPISFEGEVSNHGSDNIIFTTGDAKKYIFRVIFSDANAIHNSSQIYEYLYQAGIPTAQPIKTSGNEYVVDAGDEIADRNAGYSIHSFVEGSEVFADELLPHLIDEIAKYVGKFHHALHDLEYSSMDLRGRSREDVLAKSEQLDVGFSGPWAEQVPDHPLVREMYDFWSAWKDSIDFSALHSGLIHGDIGPGANIMMHDGRVAAIIDLINADFGYYMEDIGTFVMYGGLYLEERVDLLSRFKQTYLLHAPLSEDEFALLPFFVLRRFLLQAFYFGWRLRVGYTQGNESDDGNDVGFNDALGFLTFWKEHFMSLMS